MFTNTGYLLYQAERRRTRAEQCRADASTGRLAASLARALRSLRYGRAS
jgi:hypothetical protein